MDMDDIIIVLESHGWSYFGDGTGRIAGIEKSSPLGRVVSIDIPDGGTVPKKVHRLAERFDPNVHVAELVRRSMPGRPTDVRALCDDADAIKAMLDDLDKAFHAASKPASRPVTVLALSRVLNDYDHDVCSDKWLIDPGDIGPIVDALNEYLARPKGKGRR